MLQRMIAAAVCFFFFCSNFQYANAQTFSVSQLPLPGKMVEASSAFIPASLKGIVVDPNKPLEFQFIVDTGDGSRQSDLVKEEANQLVKYFLAGLTIPEGDLWVNLSPYEKDRIVPDALGQTDLGRDLLAQDYILKQLTASAIYPEKELGKEFWNKVYAKAQAQYGITNIPVKTFNKVWIMPKEAQVFENNNAAYVTKSTLKVMLDEDYLSKEKHQASKAPNVTSEIVRSIVLPEIEREVNSGKNFAPLRQIYQALILAKWYRETVKNAIFEAVYTNKSKTDGINLSDMALKEKIYARYLDAYKKGVFNFIKEERSKPKKYFSGGITEIEPKVLDRKGIKEDVKQDGAMMSINVSIASTTARTAPVYPIIQANPEIEKALGEDDANADLLIDTAPLDIRMTVYAPQVSDSLKWAESHALFTAGKSQSEIEDDRAMLSYIITLVIGGAIGVVGGSILAFLGDEEFSWGEVVGGMLIFPILLNVVLTPFSLIIIAMTRAPVEYVSFVSGLSWGILIPFVGKNIYKTTLKSIDYYKRRSLIKKIRKLITDKANDVETDYLSSQIVARLNKSLLHDPVVEDLWMRVSSENKLRVYSKALFSSDFSVRSWAVEGYEGYNKWDEVVKMGAVVVPVLIEHQRWGELVKMGPMIIPALVSELNKTERVYVKNRILDVLHNLGDSRGNERYYPVFRDVYGRGWVVDVSAYEITEIDDWNYGANSGGPGIRKVTVPEEGHWESPHEIIGRKIDHWEKRERVVTTTYSETVAYQKELHANMAKLDERAAIQFDGKQTAPSVVEEAIKKNNGIEASLFHHMQVSQEQEISEVYGRVQGMVYAELGKDIPVLNVNLDEIHVTIANDDVAPQEKLSFTLKQLVEDIREDAKGVGAFKISLVGPHLMPNGAVVMEYTTAAPEFLYLRKKAEQRRHLRQLSEGNRASVPTIMHSTVSVIRDPKISQEKLEQLRKKLNEYRASLQPIEVRIDEITVTHFDEATRRFLASEKVLLGEKVDQAMITEMKYVMSQTAGLVTMDSVRASREMMPSEKDLAMITFQEGLIYFIGAALAVKLILWSMNRTTGTLPTKFDEKIPGVKDIDEHIKNASAVLQNTTSRFLGLSAVRAIASSPSANGALKTLRITAELHSDEAVRVFAKACLAHIAQLHQDPSIRQAAAQYLHDIDAQEQDMRKAGDKVISSMTQMDSPLTLGSISDGKGYIIPALTLTQPNLFTRIGESGEVIIKVPSKLGLKDFKKFVKTEIADPQDIRSIEPLERFTNLDQALVKFSEFTSTREAFGDDIAHFLAVHRMQYERLKTANLIRVPETRFVVLAWKEGSGEMRHSPAIVQEKVPGVALWDMVNRWSGKFKPQYADLRDKIRDQLLPLINSDISIHIDWNIKNFVWNPSENRLYYVDSKPSLMASKSSVEHNLASVREVFIDYDAAMTSMDEDRASKADYGGIDLNQINVNKEGKRVVVKFDPAMLKNLIQGDFKGFTPTITNIQPIASPLPLLGVAATRDN